MIKEVVILSVLITLCVSIPTKEPNQFIAPAVQKGPVVVLPDSDSVHEEMETAETAQHHHHHHHLHHHHLHHHGHGHGYGPVRGGLGGGRVGVGVAVGVVGGGFVGRK